MGAKSPLSKTLLFSFILLCLILVQAEDDFTTFPSSSPFPTKSNRPSSSPTISHSPTLSNHPSNAPTLSVKPSLLPTTHPTSAPSTSSAPTSSGRDLSDWLWFIFLFLFYYPLIFVINLPSTIIGLFINLLQSLIN